MSMQGALHVRVMSGQVPIVRVPFLRLQSVQINRQETLAIYRLEMD